jgi:small-conductance mechanosensitive channel
VLPRFVLPVLLLIAITALLWLSYGFASTYQLFGSAALASIFRAAATVATAILFVVVAAHLVFRLGFAWLLQHDPTHLQRGLVVALLSFVAAAIALAYFGLDVGTILTTSALVSAIVGLSLQPMLGSLISGLTLHRLIRIGDGVLLNGEQVEITSLNWCSMVARRPNGSTVVVSNARLTDSTLEVLAHDRPTRAEVLLELPTAIAPHRVRKLVTGIIDDFSEVDSTQSIVVLPQKHAGSHASTTYRAAFWVSQYAERADVEGRVLRRTWYAFQREGIASHIEARPDQESDAKSAGLVSTICAALRTAPMHLNDAPETLTKSVIAAGVSLLYDDGERIVLPERLAGCFCVLIDGELSEITPARENPSASVPSKAAARAGHELTRAASLALIERALAARIGPYAGHSVARASANGASLAVICTAVAEEIDDPDERRAFLREARPPAQQMWGPGFLFRCQRDSAQRLVSQPPLRAVDYALMLVAPEAALEAADEPNDTAAARPGKK